MELHFCKAEIKAWPQGHIKGIFEQHHQEKVLFTDAAEHLAQRAEETLETSLSVTAAQEHPGQVEV